MKTTKQKRRYSIGVPASVIDVLRWHVETQLRTDEQRRSELLFPSDSGGFRTPKVLNGPLAQVAAELGITRKFTQRGLRRTYCDLMRAKGVNDLVTRSISGHQTESMQHRYSTVQGGEQREGIAKILQFAHPCVVQTGEDRGEGGAAAGELRRGRKRKRVERRNAQPACSKVP